METTDNKPAGRLATPTPATDGEHVVVFFGSSGLLCYDTDGKIYFASDRGEVIVVSAQPQWEELSSAQFDGPIYPSPAISDGRIDLRTEARLFCFSVPESP